jgi:hypothetical protein
LEAALSSGVGLRFDLGDPLRPCYGTSFAVVPSKHPAFPRRSADDRTWQMWVFENRSYLFQVTPGYKLGMR